MIKKEVGNTPLSRLQFQPNLFSSYSVKENQLLRLPFLFFCQSHTVLHLSFFSYVTDKKRERWLSVIKGGDCGMVLVSKVVSTSPKDNYSNATITTQ